MTIWMLFGGMTLLAVAAVLWPLSRHRVSLPASETERRFYADQIAEIERDVSRGLLVENEAEAARIEAGRRLLRAASLIEGEQPGVGEPALRRRRAVSALAFSLIPIMAVAVYGATGSPHMPAHPLSAREPSSQTVDLVAAIAQIEAHLRKQPQDGRGWEVIAPVYLQMGRMQEAVRAYEAALRLLGRGPDRLAAYGEALVLAANGIMPEEARAAFKEALAQDPDSPKARAFLASAGEPIPDQNETAENP